MNLITAPFSALLMLFYNLFGSYGWAILAFGVVLKLITLPFQMKSTKSMMQNSMLQPRMKELEKKYANDKQKYQEELAKLIPDYDVLIMRVDPAINKEILDAAKIMAISAATLLA